MIRQCLLCEATSAGTHVRFLNQMSKICTWCRGELARTGRGFCPGCEKVYPLAEMTDRARLCKACKRARSAAHRERNRDHILAQQRAHYAEKPRRGTATPAQRHAYYLRHRDDYRAARHAWRERNKERIRAYNKAYNAALPPSYWIAKRERAKVRMFRRVFQR